MKYPGRSLFSLVVVGLMCTGLARAGEPSAMPRKKVLFFSKSSGFEHEAIKLKWKEGKPGYAFPVLEELGRKNNIAFSFSKDGSLFTAEYLAQFDAFVFFTTGDLTLARNDAKYGDDNPPMTPEGKRALLKAIENGKGFVGVHSATDTFHAPGNKDHGPERFQNDGEKTDAFAKMLGAEFIQHGAQQRSHLTVTDPKFPGMAAVATDFGPNEEWYSLKNFAPDLHVLLVQETASMKGMEYARPPFPATWARMSGKGRVFYTNMGHREDVWTDPTFQAVLLGGLEWTLRRVDADVTPNLAQAAPQAAQLPAYVAPKSGAPKRAEAKPNANPRTP